MLINPITIATGTTALVARRLKKNAEKNKRSSDTSPSVDTSSFSDDPTYQALLEANPYKNTDYQLGIWDKIGNAFGFRTAEDKRFDEMQQASNEYASQLATMKREEEYNSESSQVARAKAAGLNPDLTGVQNAQASEFNEPETTPTVDDGSGNFAAARQVVQDLSGGLLNIATTSMNLASNFESMKGIKLQNQASELGLLGNAMDIGKKFLLNMIESDKYDNKQLKSVDFDNYLTQLDLGMNSKAQKRLGNIMMNTYSSPGFQKDYFDIINGLESGRYDVASKRAQPYYSTSDQDMIQFLRPFVTLQFQLNKLSTENRYKYEAKSSELNIPEMKASGEFEESRNQYYEKQFWADYNKAINKFTGSLKDQMDKGSLAAALALVYIGNRSKTFGSKGLLNGLLDQKNASMGNISNLLGSVSKFL